MCYVPRPGYLAMHERIECAQPVSIFLGAGDAKFLFFWESSTTSYVIPLVNIFFCKDIEILQKIHRKYQSILNTMKYNIGSSDGARNYERPRQTTSYSNKQYKTSYNTQRNTASRPRPPPGQPGACLRRQDELRARPCRHSHTRAP